MRKAAREAEQEIEDPDKYYREEKDEDEGDGSKKPRVLVGLPRSLQAGNDTNNSCCTPSNLTSCQPVLQTPESLKLRLKMRVRGLQQRSVHWIDIEGPASTPCQPKPWISMASNISLPVSSPMRVVSIYIHWPPEVEAALQFWPRFLPASGASEGTA